MNQYKIDLHMCRSLRANGGIQMNLPHDKSAIRIDPNDNEELSEHNWAEFLNTDPTFISVSQYIIPDLYAEYNRKYGWKPIKRTKEENEQLAKEADALLKQYLRDAK